MELDLRVGHDRDMESHAAVLEVQVEVGVLLDYRAWRQPHEAHGAQRGVERIEDLAKVGAGGEHRRILEILAGRIGVDHYHRMLGAGLAAQRDHAPVALVVLPHEMRDPVD